MLHSVFDDKYIYVIVIMYITKHTIFCYVTIYRKKTRSNIITDDKLA